MITLTNADKALKEVYLGVVSEQLNTSVNPLLAKIAPKFPLGIAIARPVSIFTVCPGRISIL